MTEGKMSLDGEATDAPITVKDAARFLGVRVRVKTRHLFYWQ